MTLRKKGGFNFKKNKSKFRRTQSVLPRAIGLIAVEFFKGNFRKGGFVDRSLRRWKKRAIEGNRPGRAILVDTGKLKRSIKILTASKRQIKIGTSGVSYATLQNEGGTVTAKKQFLFIPLTPRAKRKRKGQPIPKDWKWGVDYIMKESVEVPERKFIGDSVMLNKKIAKRIKQELDKVFA